jgi:glutathione S-transferase|nr:MAG: glutathione transferase GstA [Pseudomonadota bacterium]
MLARLADEARSKEENNMKLYYLPGACSLASHIALIEAGRKFEAIAVDRATKKGTDGTLLTDLNPRGYVPVLVLDDGQVLTENVAVLSYISTLDASGRLAPQPGTMGFFRVLEWLGFINSEIHKNLGVMFRPTSTGDMKKAALEMALLRYGYVNQALGDRHFLTGENFTVADAYLYVTLSWSPRLQLDLSHLPKLGAYFERCAARPSVQQARTEEGLPPR